MTFILTLKLFIAQIRNFIDKVERSEDRYGWRPEVCNQAIFQYLTVNNIEIKLKIILKNVIKINFIKYILLCKTFVGLCV